VKARRRLAVLAGHRGDAESAAALARDGDPSVRAAALGALARSGAMDTGMLVGALSDPDPLVRIRASKLSGMTAQRATEGDAVERPPSDLLEALTGATCDSEPEVAESAAWALGEWGDACPPAAGAALRAMASGHTDPLCREAAVAALGAARVVGAVPVLLAALKDKVAVRRRAVIALSAFDDPRVEGAMRSCLGDRDWQVRQAAEDLLDQPEAP